MGSKKTSNVNNNANLPRWRDGWTDKKTGKPMQGFWYVWHDGKQVNLTRYGAPRANGTKANTNLALEARAKMLEEKGQEQIETDQAAVVAANKVLTIYDVLQHYVKTRLPQLSRDAKKNIKIILENFCTGKDGKGSEVNGVLPYKGFGNLPASAMSKKLLDEWTSYHPNWGRAGKRSAITPVKSAFSLAAEYGLIESSPVKGYKLPQGKAREEEVTPEQEKALREQAAKLRPALGILLAASLELGTRPGELATLRCHHFDAKSGEWVLESHEWKCGKKTGKQRRIALTPAWIKWTQDRIAELDGEDGYLFTTEKGCGWGRSRWDQHFRDVREAAKVPATITLYSARHSFITRALNAGVAVADIAMQCGTSIMEIQSVYSKLHLHPESRKRVVMAVAATAVPA